MSERELIDEPEDAGAGAGVVPPVDEAEAEEVAVLAAEDPLDDPVDDPGAPAEGEEIEIVVPVAAEGSGDDWDDEDDGDDGDAGLEERVQALLGDIAGVVEDQVSQVQAALRDVLAQSQSAGEDVAELVEREV